jgi:uncharacterized protein (TIGR03437 family)
MMKLLLVFAAVLPLFSQTANQCISASLSSGGLVAAATATDISNPANFPSFTVSTQPTCPFVATTAATWIHLQPPSKGVTFLGTSKVSFTVEQNAGTQLRQDVIVIYFGTQAIPGEATLTYTVDQVAGTCVYTPLSYSASVPVTGASGSITVTSGCAWNFNSSAFITVTAPNGTLGTAILNYQVAANPCVAPRTGQINVLTGLPNPPIYEIVQDGSTSNLTISSNSLNTGPAALANQHLTVTTGAGCPWNSYTDSANWLHLTGATSGNGPGVLNYSIDANLGGQRTGHVFFQSGTDVTGSPFLATTLTVTQSAFQAPAPQLSGILNAASYATGPASPVPVSAGEIVSLFGTNLGPAAPVTNTQTFGTSLAGVQVMFGNTPAPLIFVYATQINAVVPYEVDGSSSVAVTVQYSGAQSAALTVPVQSTTPGIFSYDHSGTGPGAILNQDYTLNSAARPAAAGTVVQIYCTGAGVTVPASKDGALTTLTPPFPAVAAQPVTVTIGGVSAQVVYAGAAPGAIAGLTQIDAVVPSGAPSGPSIPIVVSIGGVPSQGNLSMAVQ